MTIKSLRDIILHNLHIHGGFSLINLGTITLNRTAATYSSDRKSIIPPKTSLIYKKEYSSGFDITRLTNDFEELLAPLHTYLSSDNRENTQFIIPGMGTIEKNEQGITFHIEENLSWENSYKSWPVLPITPKGINPKNIEFAIENPNKLILPVKNVHKNKVNFLFPLLVICICSFTLMFRFISTDKTVVQESKYVSKESNDMKRDSVMTEETVKNNSEVIEDTLLSLSSESQGHSENKNVDVEKNASVKKLAENTDKISETEIKSDKKSCIYIVGAFTNKKNAHGLKSKLKKDGFEAEYYPSGKFYRVGISLSCNTDTSVTFKELIKDFPGIWLLNP